MKMPGGCLGYVSGHNSDHSELEIIRLAKKNLGPQRLAASYYVLNWIICLPMQAKQGNFDFCAEQYHDLCF